MSKFQLVLLIHGHQPVGNFLIRSLSRSTRFPISLFLDCLERHPGVRLGLHYTGPLLEWFERSHPEFMARLRKMSDRGQIEIVGGGFYEPILVTIPAWDQAAQIGRMRDYIARKFGKAPAGAWLAERVWEPQVPSVMASSGVQYTLVDDIHFTGAGFEAEQLFGDYICEDGGKTIRAFPGLKTLRYLFPFASVEDGIGFLRDSAARHPGGMAAMGDDCEKFGAWPGTFDLCYTHGWLGRPLHSAFESNADWLATVTPAEYLATHQPLGRADLPTASYTEMMEWALPTSARFAFQAVTHEFESRPDVLRFVRGGPWRAFFTKYAESNLLHKKMLRASQTVRRLESARPSGDAAEKLAAARTHVLCAQCNDAFWHGIFGGLYAPHLRTVLWSELIRAEAIAAELDPPKDGMRAERVDFDADGAEEIFVDSPRLAALLRPADGGTLAMLDFRPRAVTLVNSVQRRPETYHSKLRDMAAGGGAAAGGVVSIHNQMRVKETGLEQLLRYDRWPRNAFRLLAFPVGKTFDDYRQLQLDEQPALAAAAYPFATPPGASSRSPAMFRREPAARPMACSAPRRSASPKRARDFACPAMSSLPRSARPNRPSAPASRWSSIFSRPTSPRATSTPAPRAIRSAGPASYSPPNRQTVCASSTNGSASRSP